MLINHDGHGCWNVREMILIFRLGSIDHTGGGFVAVEVAVEVDRGAL